MASVDSEDATIYANVEVVRRDPPSRQNCFDSALGYENSQIIMATIKMETALKEAERDYYQSAAENTNQRKSFTPTDNPPLTEQHVFASFKGSGITMDQVMQLGTLLDIPRDELEILQLEQKANPAMCAMLTIHKWKKLHPECEDLQYAYKRLEEVLRECHLNKIIPRLHSFNECVEIDWTQIFLKKHVVKEIRGFTPDQAEIFGESLGIDKNEIQALKEQSRARTGSQIALAAFDEWERRTTLKNDHTNKIVISSLVKASSNAQDLSLSNPSTPSHVYNEQNAPVSSPEPTFISTIPVATNPMYTCTDGRDSNTEDGKHCSLLEKGNMRNTCSCIFVVTSLTAFIITMACLLLLPSIPTFPSQPIIPTDVILYELPIDSYWLDSISLELLSYGSCSAEVISVKCSDTESTIELANDSSTLGSIDYLYLTKNTELTISLDGEYTSKQCQYHIPYYVWLFTSFSEAVEHTKNDFDFLSCSDPPSNVWCVKINDCSSSINFTITKSSYYFIRCSRNDKSCTLLADIVIDLVKYNFVSTQNAQIHSVQLQSGQDGNDLKLHKNLLSEDGQVCIMAVVSIDEACQKEDGVNHIVVRNYHRRRGLYIFPFFFLLLTCLVITVVVLVYVKKRVTCHKKGKLNINS